MAERIGSRHLFGPDSLTVRSRPSATSCATGSRPTTPGASPPATTRRSSSARQWQRKLHEARLRRSLVAEGVRRPRRDADRAGDLQRGDGARRGALAPANVLGLVMGGPVVITHGTDEQKQRFLEPILIGRRDLVPGLLGARVGLRPRVAQDQGGQVERRAGSSPARRSGRPSPTRPSGACSWRARDSGRAQAPGPHLLPHGHGAGGRAGAPAAPDHRRGRVQRDLHRGGAHPRRERRRPAWATAGTSPSRR